jgi:hypothetical protein
LRHRGARAQALERRPGEGVLKLRGDVPAPTAQRPVTVVLGDGTGPLCASLGEARPKAELVASSAVSGRTVTVSFGGGLVVVKGKKLALDALDDPNVHVGISLGAQRFAGAGAFRTRGAKRVHP